MTNGIICNASNGVYSAHNYSQAYVGGKKPRRGPNKRTQKGNRNNLRKSRKLHKQKKSRKSRSWYSFIFS